MPSPLFTLDGMITGHHALVLDEVLDHAIVGPDGRLLVSMVDVLAIARLDRDADVLLVEFVDGASRAIRMADVLERDGAIDRALDRASSRSGRRCVALPTVVRGLRGVDGGGLDQGDDLCSVRRIAMNTLETVWMPRDRAHPWHHEPIVSPGPDLVSLMHLVQGR